MSVYSSPRDPKSTSKRPFRRYRRRLDFRFRWRMFPLIPPLPLPSPLLIHPQNYIHIRIQQRNGRKTLTTVQGVPAEYDLKRILKALKKVYSALFFSLFLQWLIFLRISHATALSLKVRNWEKSFNFKEINATKFLNSFLGHFNSRRSIFLAPPCIANVKVPSKSTVSSPFAVVSSSSSSARYISSSPWADYIIILVSSFCSRSRFPFIVVLCSSSSMSTTSLLLSDFQHLSQYHHQPQFIRCSNSSRGRRKRGGCWQTSMDSRDRHRRRGWYLSFFLLFCLLGLYIVWIAGIIACVNRKQIQLDGYYSYIPYLRPTPPTDVLYTGSQISRVELPLDCPNLCIVSAGWLYLELRNTSFTSWMAHGADSECDSLINVNSPQTPHRIASFLKRVILTKSTDGAAGCIKIGSTGLSPPPSPIEKCVVPVLR